MVGPVDFEKDADYWQQDRWNGQFPVQWHIIKDVPNIRFRHILLENNDNKPVTHSRDCQEVVNLSPSVTCIQIISEFIQILKQLWSLIWLSNDLGFQLVALFQLNVDKILNDCLGL